MSLLLPCSGWGQVAQLPYCCVTKMYRYLFSVELGLLIFPVVFENEQLQMSFHFLIQNKKVSGYEREDFFRIIVNLNMLQKNSGKEVWQTLLAGCHSHHLQPLFLVNFQHRVTHETQVWPMAYEQKFAESYFQETCAFLIKDKFGWNALWHSAPFPPSTQIINLQPGDAVAIL